MSRAILFGATGVFGGHVARELVKRGVPLTVAGRDRSRIESFQRTLSGDVRTIAADVTNRDSCNSAIEGHGVAVNCAGPFNVLGAALLEACLDSRCHYADIADDRAYTALVQSRDAECRDREIAAVFGCSSLPGISGALALHLARDLALPVVRVRCTLFVGNRNPKGSAAVGSMIAGLGRPIAAPQGTLRGFRDREVVRLPPPFGPRSVYNFDTPEYDLFPELLGAKAVSVKLGFELGMVTNAFALMARTGLKFGRRTARLLDLPGRVLGGLGCSGGAVMTELFLTDGSVRRASMSGATDGQRMAALPCTFVAEALARGTERIGSMAAYDFLGAKSLLDGLIAAGFTLREET